MAGVYADEQLCSAGARQPDLNINAGTVTELFVVAATVQLRVRPSPVCFFPDAHRLPPVLIAAGQVRHTSALQASAQALTVEQGQTMQKKPRNNVRGDVNRFTFSAGLWA
ncbi:hypothetical protein D3C76_1578520 [compost metagenome]